MHVMLNGNKYNMLNCFRSIKFALGLTASSSTVADAHITFCRFSTFVESDDWLLEMNFFLHSREKSFLPNKNSPCKHVRMA